MTWLFYLMYFSDPIVSGLIGINRSLGYQFNVDRFENCDINQLDSESNDLSIKLMTELLICCRLFWNW